MPSLSRIAAGSLPGFLFLAGLGLLVASPLAWGAGDHAGLAPWQPPLVGVLFALPPIAIGFTTLRLVSRKTRQKVLVHGLPLVFGVLFLFGGSLVVWGLIAAVPDPATYDALLEAPNISPDGPPGFEAAQRGVQFQQNASPAGFLAIAVLVGAFMFAWIWAAAYSYTTAFQPDPVMKYEAAMNEVDAVGMLIRGQHGQRQDA